MHGNFGHIDLCSNIPAVGCDRLDLHDPNKHPIEDVLPTLKILAHRG